MPRKGQMASVAEESAAPGGAIAVDRALSLLSAFQGTDKSGLSLAELAERTQLYKSTALRLMASLLHAGLLHQREDGRYTLGSGVARQHQWLAWNLKKLLKRWARPLYRWVRRTLLERSRPSAGN